MGATGRLTSTPGQVMLRRILTVWIFLVVLVGVLPSLPTLVAGHLSGLADLFLFHQDILVVAPLFAVAASPWLAPGVALDLGRLCQAFARSKAVNWLGGLQPRLVVASLCAGCALAGWVGATWVYDNYTLSMDEFMATFDAVILSHGQLLAPVSIHWREYIDALAPAFVRNFDQSAYWVSDYLPVNAGFRALGGLAGAASLVNPILTSISVVAVFAVGRRMWPRRPGLALAAAILLGTSSQVLIAGMTSYAMPAHLALNLVWLWLFLRGGRLGHAGALVVGCLACGLHQLAFHPLFVAPFVAQLWLERRWRAAVLYTVAYAAICLFWVEYWQIAIAVTDTGSVLPATAAAQTGASGFLDQARAIAKSFDLGSAALMAKNIIRFVTWQNPLTAPLLALSAWPAFQARGTTRSLILGFATTLGAVCVLMPYQGHGWGYRYLHGLLGSSCLLAAWQWGRMADALSSPERAVARGAFAMATAGSLFILFPLRALQAHQFVHPYAVAERAIRLAPTDVVLVDDRGILFGIDLVRNDPYLLNRPLVMYADALTVEHARSLCANATISMLDSASAGGFGIPRVPVDSSSNLPHLADSIKHWNCHGAPVRAIVATP